MNNAHPVLSRRIVFSGLLFILISLACRGGRPLPTPTAGPLATSTGPSPVATAADCGPAGPNAPAAQVHLRLNQAGYLPSESKLALALTDETLAGENVDVVSASDGGVVLSVAVGADRGPYGNFAHLYELDFSGLNEPGAYQLTAGGDTSPCFVVGAAAYAALIPATLQFFRVQRCGDTDPRLHEVCHREDGVAQGGPADGEHIDASGGWHDAGDYLKFLNTTAYSADLMLTAYQRHPRAFADGDENGTPDVLDEARVGLSWMLKLWNPERDVLYYQVGDGSDHDEWRMPEGDDASRPVRLVWASEPGRGANLAGKASAAFALAADVWGEPASAIYDPALAADFLAAARQLYAYGQERPAAQSGTSLTEEVFYAEETWEDDLALAAAELYRATQETAYLDAAREYAAAGAGEGRPLDWGEVGPLARYEIARLDSDYLPTAASLLADDLANYQAHADADPFHVAAEFGWGSAQYLVGAALTALWYEDLSGDAAYRPMALAQWDYLLGGNPWGLTFVNSIGSYWPRRPHHQVADLTGSELVGFWNEGPVPLADFIEQGITLRDDDALAAFQTDAAVYHDDVEDYVTNEPTIVMNAAGLALAAWFGPLIASE